MRGPFRSALTRVVCLLVLIAVWARRPQELVALTDGNRESVESWADLLRDCARRGMRAPRLAICVDQLRGSPR